MRHNNCIDCNTKIDFRATRCPECHYLFKVGKNNSNYKHGKYILNQCPHCAKKIHPRAKRCRSCASKLQWKNSIKLQNRNQYGIKNPMFGVHRFGNNNPNWQGGIAKLPYAFEFTSELKESIRKRDDYICQNCGMVEEEHLIVYGEVLNCHHINYNKQNCKENNLISLCISCNSRANANRSYWKNLYREKIKCLQK